MCGLPGFALPALGWARWLWFHSCLRERQSGLEDGGRWQLWGTGDPCCGSITHWRKDKQGHFHRAPMFSDLKSVKKPLDYIQNMSPNHDTFLI